METDRNDAAGVLIEEASGDAVRPDIVDSDVSVDFAGFDPGAPPKIAKSQFAKFERSLKGWSAFENAARSMWRGYLENDDGRSVQKWFENGGSRAAHIHASGHASPGDLKTFANSIKPRWLVPIHGVAWDTEAEEFPPIRRLTDGEQMTISADE